VAEESLIKIERMPWAETYLILIGAGVPELNSLLFGHDASASSLALLLISVLAMVRLGPAVVRRAIPFSPEAQSIWMRRRALAKRYDSYQWRKLFWVGLGLGFNAALWNKHQSYLIIAVLVCCLPGSVGLIIWRRRQMAEIMPKKSQ
jgi:hypothetical protein